MIGQRLGHYRILAKLGAGGMGEVYRAHDEQLDRDVALKLLPASSLTDESARARLLREARAASALNHPHICTIHEVGEAAGQAYIAMEYVEGRPLSSLIGTQGLDAATVVRYGLQLAEALAHAHQRGVLHRDLKSLNVVITPEGRAKILDFGLAKRLREQELEEATRSQASLTETQAIGGTLPYMAPEQLRGQPADARSDLWALGVVLYEAASGERPFKGQTGFELSAAILREPLAPLPARVPAALRAVIERCLEKEPARRYQQAGELRAALEAVQSGAAPMPYTPSPQAPAWGRIGPRWRVPPGSAGLILRWGVPATVVVLLAAVLLGLNVGGVRQRLSRSFGAGPPQVDSLAVLPLENLSGDPEQDYFVDGMTDELIAQLAQIGTLKVISRTSVMQYKGTKKPLPEIARELNVDAVVEGSARRAGNRVRITAQLIHAATDRHLWAQTYERDLKDVLALQSEVARAIAGEIRIKLTPQEQARLASARPVNPEAYELYLRGRYHSDKRTPEALKKGLEYFQAAIDADPGYALGYVGLADSHRQLNNYGVVPPSEAYPRAKAALARALELDDTLAEAHASLAQHYAQDWDWQAADREYQRAFELNPNYATAHQWYALYLSSLERHEGAIREIKRARELDPLSPIIRGAQVMTLFYARKYDETIEECQKALEVDPTFGWFHGWQGAAYLEKGMLDKGLAEVQQHAARSPTPNVLARLGYARARAGQRGEALKIAHQLEELSKRQYVSSYDIALVYVGLGENPQALSWLEKAYKNKEGVMWMAFLKVSPWFDRLRDDPRFQALLRRMNFPP